MADATKTEVYATFQAEKARLETEIITLKSSNDLRILDTLAANQAKLDHIIARLPELAAASEQYEREQRHLALLAAQTPRWAAAAEAKRAALADVSTRLRDLMESINTYNAAHGAQTSVLRSLAYSRQFQQNFAAAPASAIQICTTILQGDHTWLGRVRSFDAIGTSEMLPYE